ncbi:MAG: peptidase S8, partial [Actinobacteria bacterium]
MNTGRAISGAHARVARFLLAVALVAPTALGAIPARGADSTAGEPTPATTGELIVGVEPNTSAAVALKAEAAGAEVSEVQRAAGFIVVQPPAGDSAAHFTDALAEIPGVRFAQPEHRVRASFTPNDPEFADQWNMQAVGASGAWDVQRGRGAVKVAIIDTGVDLLHPDLIGRIDTVHDKDFVDGDMVAQDVGSSELWGHGTHVAGIIAADIDNGRDVAGLGPGITILPIRVLDSKGWGEDSDLALGIRYAADQGVDVINVSIGGPNDSQVLLDAVNYAVSKGSLIVAASGNDPSKAYLDFPAAYPQVVAVGSVNVALARSNFSQYGDGLDFVAPGS